MTSRSAVESRTITKFSPSQVRTVEDDLTVEEPLEIRLAVHRPDQDPEERIAVTMRTPGDDFELAVGFLFTEGLLHSYRDIQSIRYCQTEKAAHRGNVVRVQLRAGVDVDTQRLRGHSYRNSSCGLCGRASIEAVQVPPTVKHQAPATPCLHPSALYTLTETLRQQQVVFQRTGSIHAAGLFAADGQLLLLYEDVGRHNAVDKLIGAALIRGWLPLREYCIIVSGRAGFELVQKSVVAGLGMMGAVGAPSNLAVALAEEYGMALVGFIKRRGVNIYTGDFSATTVSS